MKHFPEFIKDKKNKAAKVPEGMEGFVFDGADGSQVILWENVTGGKVSLHKHDYWEYCYVMEGTYDGIVGGKAVHLGPGDEYAIPPGVPHEGTHSPDYRAIDIFGGKRIERE